MKGETKNKEIINTQNGWEELTPIELTELTSIEKQAKSTQVKFTESNYTVSLPPKSAAQVRFPTKGTGWCESMEIAKGAFTPSTIVRAVEGLAWMLILNTTDTAQHFDNLYSHKEPISNFKVN